jgi:hypothetical protein
MLTSNSETGSYKRGMKIVMPDIKKSGVIFFYAPANKSNHYRGFSFGFYFCWFLFSNRI